MIEEKYNVVLTCGGLGTRLKQVTRDVPKPLYPILGKSTLERCIKELKKNSLDNILITTGYKSEKFEASIVTLKEKYNVNLDIFVEDSPLGECGALWLIKEKLNDDFIFINGDLIFSIDFVRLINFHRRLSSNLTLVTHTCDHPEDSDLVSAPNGTLIENIFLKNEIKINEQSAYLGNAGICIIKKNIIDKITPPETKESKSIFHLIVKNIFNLNLNIYSYNTSEYIKDMGTPKRFIHVKNDLASKKVYSRNYFNKQKALFLDRDNTLIKCDIGDYIVDTRKIKFLEKNILKISRIAKNYDLVCIVTNQPLIAMGKLTLRNLEYINAILVNFCLSKGLKIDVITFCPHHPHQGFDKEIYLLKKDCFCRKPNPGLFQEQAFLRNIDLKQSLMIGDSEIDFLASENAGCNFINVDSL